MQPLKWGCSVSMSFTVFCSASCSLPAERPAVDHPCYFSKHTGSRGPECQQGIGVLGVAVPPNGATLHLQPERHGELAMQV